MLQKLLKLSLCLVILSACVKTSCNNYELPPLPELPIAGTKVADELEQICVKENQCIAINTWLNELYLFHKQYDIYKRISTGDE